MTGIVVHVVPLLSPTAAFGGPTRVALNHVKELRARGIEVELLAGSFSMTGEDSCDGTRVLLFRARRLVSDSFATLFSIRLLFYLLRNFRKIAQVHVHGGRDLLSVATTTLCRVVRRPYVIQGHGMIARDDRRAVAVWDALLTRPALENAGSCLCLTDDEESELARIAPACQTTRIRNGLAPVEVENDVNSGIDVLFMARLHPRKNPRIFVQAAIQLLEKHPDVVWSIVGPDEGELTAVRELVEKAPSSRVSYEGALGYVEAERRLAKADVYVLPSVDEPFPMSLLEALRAGIPSICTDTCGIAKEVEAAGAATVIQPSLQALVDALDCLLSDEGLRRNMSRAGQRLVKEEFSITSVVDKLVEVYGAKPTSPWIGGGQVLNEEAER